MMNIHEILEKVCAKKDLNFEEASYVMSLILAGDLSESLISAILIALKMKEETLDEIAAFAKVMREKSIFVNTKDLNVIDTCGTGGDGLNTFNISTASAIIAAGAGCYIAKHGNKSVSSKCGSADVLENLGVNLASTPEQMSKMIKKNGIAFLFAPKLHVAMKNVMPVRKSLGIRTIFNILGPLTNPARAKKQIVGVFDKKLCAIYAEVLKQLGHKEAYVVHGEDGLDEVSISDNTLVYHLKDGEINSFYIEPEYFGINRVNISEIKGGNASHNAQIIINILNGEKSAYREISCINAAFVIALSGISKDLKTGYQLACDAIDSKKALQKLENWQKEMKPSA